MKKVRLHELPFAATFRQHEYGQGHILVKSVFVKDSKIGVYNPFGQVIYLEKDTEVFIVSNSRDQLKS